MKLAGDTDDPTGASTAEVQPEATHMSTNYRALSVRWPAPPLASPRRFDADFAGPRPAAALLRVRRLLDALAGAWRERYLRNGGPPSPPEDQPTSASIWNDPALWMLMMH
jgi:hypothetical protein